MKHWKETRDVADRIVTLGAASRQSALATVVQTSGSSYRRAGAKFLIEDTGQTMGGVSGGCLEGDVREIGLDVIRTGISKLVHYDTGGDDRPWGLGLGCNGSLDVFVQPTSNLPAQDLQLALLELAEEQHGSLMMATVVDGPIGAGRSFLLNAIGRPVVTTGQADFDCDIAGLADIRRAGGQPRLEIAAGRQVFVDVVNAPPHLIVCGANDDARSLVAYAADVGFSVTVVDHRPAYLEPNRFPAAHRLLDIQPADGVEAVNPGSSTFVVIKTHSFARDLEWVRQFVRSGAAYVGLLGSRTRRDEIVRQVGTGADQLFSPVGLDLAADGPEQIAISILAEVLAVRAGRVPASLRTPALATHTG